MSESPKKEKEDNSSAKNRAREGLEKRSKKGSNEYYYWIVIVGFVVMCLGCVVYVIYEWRDSPNLISAVDIKSIEKHNAKNLLFKRGSNTQFQTDSLDTAKRYFQSFLSDDFKDLYYCPSKEQKTHIIPDSFDFRQKFEKCVHPVRQQANCSSAYAIALTSMISDRICMNSGHNVNVSPQAILSCDKDFNEECNKGYAQRAHDFLLRTGMVDEECFPYNQGVPADCEKKCNRTLEEGKKMSRICGVDGAETVKREIELYGPVIAKIEVHDDFLTYKSGIYSAENSLYTYAGSHIVKVIGWGVENGVRYWLIENSWGSDWGENGYAKIRYIEGDDLQISQIVLGAAYEGANTPKKAEEGNAENAPEQAEAPPTSEHPQPTEEK